MSCVTQPIISVLMFVTGCYLKLFLTVFVCWPVHPLCFMLYDNF